jgi:hypothetical protein
MVVVEVVIEVLGGGGPDLVASVAFDGAEESVVVEVDAEVSAFVEVRGWESVVGGH